MTEFKKRFQYFIPNVDILYSWMFNNTNIDFKYSYHISIDDANCSYTSRKNKNKKRVVIYLDGYAICILKNKISFRFPSLDSFCVWDLIHSSTYNEEWFFQFSTLNKILWFNHHEVKLLHKIANSLE